MYNLGEYVQNYVCRGQERSGAKVHGYGLKFADGDSVNDILIRSSYPKRCFLLALKLPA